MTSPYIYFYAIITSLGILLTLFIIRTNKHCCGLMSSKMISLPMIKYNSENYSKIDNSINYNPLGTFNPKKYKNPDDELEAEAQLLQESDLPAADTLAEAGGRIDTGNNIPFKQVVNNKLANEYEGVI